ncbi:hypothetical protein GKC30_05775 [Pseudodesulfovibrio sp. F-1]|uniref:O-antigen polymerase n=1 Tax=Pseudodesulfovibrio alkaliphilus TaxID=2661613 RepID=A0A7K1KM18_9BACT|nr:hypothetical protein [Pseudodesulfovibrio alkaliphilus]MUM77136.1 hypothetical protein [Pseudodesulfovibrio alkaliphilus]
MQSTTEQQPGRTALTGLPLAVSHAALPLATAAVGLSGPGGTSPFLPWLLLAGVGCAAAMLRPVPGGPVRAWGIFHAVLFSLLAAGLYRFAPGLAMAAEPATPLLHGLIPAVMLLLCLLWITTFGMPDRADFQRFGALLGALCIIDLAVEAAVLRAVPTVRLIGDPDVLAGLLLVSLCASLRPGPGERGMTEPDQGRRLWRGLVMVGLLACLSRPGLFAGAWVILCFGRGPLRRRSLYCTACFILLAATFLLPMGGLDSVRYVDYWLWLETLALWSREPLSLVTGFSLSVPLPLEFPVTMVPVWEAAMGSSTLFGVSIAQVPSFWLRTFLAWGVVAPLALLAGLVWLLLRRPTRMGAGLTASLIAQGMATPLLYDPAMAAPVCLAFILALRRPATLTGTQRQTTAPQPESAPDPVAEWDLRPL